MKYFITLLLLSLTINCFSQNKFDRKIKITLPDSVGIYEKARQALISNEFVVKDNHNKDTLTTYVRECSKLGYAFVRAELVNNTIILSGAYGEKKLNYFGYTITPKGYQDIIYYKGSQSWKLLVKIAEDLHGEISYLKQ